MPGQLGTDTIGFATVDGYITWIAQLADDQGPIEAVRRHGLIASLALQAASRRLTHRIDAVNFAVDSLAGVTGDEKLSRLVLSGHQAEIASDGGEQADEAHEAAAFAELHEAIADALIAGRYEEADMLTAARDLAGEAVRDAAPYSAATARKTHGRRRMPEAAGA